jgi:hypothetical protein
MQKKKREKRPREGEEEIDGFLVPGFADRS